MAEMLSKFKLPSYEKTKVRNTPIKPGRALRRPTATDRLTTCYRAFLRASIVSIERLGNIWPFLVGAVFVVVVWVVFWVVYDKIGL